MQTPTASTLGKLSDLLEALSDLAHDLAITLNELEGVTDER